MVRPRMTEGTDEMKKALFAVALVVATPAVAQEYRKASGFEQVKAYCELFATAGQTNYSLLGGPIQHANLYEQCMVLKGYTRDR
jgi:hypothetical protein